METLNVDNIFEMFKKYYFQAANQGPLTFMEALSLDLIHMLQKPTIQEFAKYMEISKPNATYRIHRLVEKGYLRKVQSEKDRRVFYLETTEKYDKDYKSDMNFPKQAREILASCSENQKRELHELFATIQEELEK